jgi:hypothetical protein
MLVKEFIENSQPLIRHSKQSCKAAEAVFAWFLSAVLYAFW